MRILIQLSVHTAKELPTRSNSATLSIAWHAFDHWIAILLCYKLRWRGQVCCNLLWKQRKSKKVEKELNLFSGHFATSCYLSVVLYYILCSYSTLLPRPLVPHFIHFFCFPQERCFVPFRSFQLFLYTRIPTQTQQHLGFLVTPQISSYLFTLGEYSG